MQSNSKCLDLSKVDPVGLGERSPISVHSLRSTDTVRAGSSNFGNENGCLRKQVHEVVNKVSHSIGSTVRVLLGGRTSM